ncbi:NACHT domain-containing protein [Madurella fahalii]|uniref:NACHT domain-containing protein n=1 Tax=Madurella fahalii TaxID=1157608 RepID=A0ABQ0GT40_9PEZI
MPVINDELGSEPKSQIALQSTVCAQSEPTSIGGVGQGIPGPFEPVQSMPKRDIWAAALERLSHQDRERFGLAKTGQRNAHEVLVEVLKATTQKKNECMEKRWKVVIKGRAIILRDVVEKISVWVSKVLKIGDIAVQYDPGQAALPWAAIRLILQATVNDVEVFGWVLQSIESIANLIATCRIFELRYTQHDASKLDIVDQLSNALVSLYTSILRYLTTILHYYSQGSAIRFVKSVVSPVADFEAAYAPIQAAKDEAWALAQLAEAEKSDRILSSLDRIEGSNDRAATTTMFETLGDALKELQEPIARATIQLADIHDGLKRETRARILRAISPIPYGVHHKTARKGRLEGSGQWLLQKPEYRSWRESSTSSVLWLHGIPGCGKTKLTSLVVDELGECDNLAYFYCMRNPAEPQRGQGAQILASLIRQLAGVSPDQPILPPVVALYEDAIAGLSDFENQAWTADETGSVLLELMGEYPAATIVLDALDEVNQEDRQELLDILSGLLRDSPNLLKIFISSRDNYDIALHFEGSPNIYIDADDNAADISSFINNQLKSAKLLHNRLPKDLEAKIVDALLRGARGMFRWVELQIQSLRPLKVAADIEARLGALPATLEGSYWELYQTITDSGDHAAALADFTFQWLMYARDTVTAGVVACIASSALPAGSAAAFTVAEIIDVCSNLVVSRNGSFEFAHLSVREFFEGLDKRKVDKFLPEHSNGHIAIACLRCLDSQIEIEGTKIIAAKTESAASSQSKDASEPIESAAQLATTTEFEHETKADSPAKCSDPTVPDKRIKPVEPGMQSADRNMENTYLNEIRIDGTESSDGKPRPLPPPGQDVPPSQHDNTEAVLYAANHWVYHVCESRDMRLTSPLADLIKTFLIAEAPGADAPYAVSEKFRMWCRIMQTRADLTYYWAEEKRLRDTFADPPNPIWLACLRGWHEVVGFLYTTKYKEIDSPRKLESLDYADPSSNQKPEVSPLWYALVSSNTALMETILSHCADPLQQRCTVITNTTLGLAAERGDEGSTKILLGTEHGGLDAEAEAFSGAAGKGHLEIVEMLLAHNAKVLSVGGYAAMRKACYNGHVRIVTFLLDRGVSTKQGAAFIHAAVFNQQLEVLQILLERRIGFSGLSKALIIAVSNHDQKSTDLLLSHGAQKEPPAVVREIKAGNLATAIRLIEAGYDISGRHLRQRRTPLHWAAERGYKDVANALLLANAPVNVYDGDRKTPLHLAATGGHEGCVELLLSNGADVMAEDAGGRIPLDWAEIRGHESTEAIIRDRMVRLMDELRKEKEALQDHGIGPGRGV